ncbi:MAG: VWA domain-containing protein [Steroidobacteraceae bacterium]
MLVDFFYELRAADLKVTVTEFLSLHEALKQRVAFCSTQEFYHLARLCLVKDERHFDIYDRVFAACFSGAERAFDKLVAQIPESWLKGKLERELSAEEKALIQSLGGWEQLMETLRQRLAEQKEQHSGGNKWIGTGGTSPFGADGFNPEGIRMGQKKLQQKKAAKVWDERQFRDYNDDVQLGTRNIKMALRRLRRFAREGAADQLDLDGTIASTARNAGMLDIRMVPERRNSAKVLLFLDVGGSMDSHVRVCEELFSAAKTEFKHLVNFYFHNCPYDRLWKGNRRRRVEFISTYDVIRMYPTDYCAIFVGDATMSPYEIVRPGGSVEHWNEEPGSVWLQRITKQFKRNVWLNPEPVERWEHTPSIHLTRELTGNRMFPLTITGLTRAIAALKRRNTQPLVPFLKDSMSERTNLE